MTKKLTTTISDHDYDLIEKFSKMPFSIDLTDKNILIDHIISNASVENMLDEPIESWWIEKQGTVWGWNNGKEFVPEQFTSKQQAIIAEMLKEQTDKAK